MQLNKILSVLFLSLISFSCYSQYSGLGFAYPLDRNIVVTGNYGEIRPNHFHAGLDLSTDPIDNLPIKSVADGYISRIKISSVGYGKVLYVTHANGYVSVYAHQHHYATKINTYTQQKQIQLKKNEIELFPLPDELPVKKGEVIGYTGNTGGSSGPHLHFEIREDKTEIPINPLLVYNVPDNVKPVITHIALYNTTDTTHIVKELSFPVKFNKGNFALPKNTYSLSGNSFAVGFAGYDMTSASANKNNIYEAKLFLDGKLIYHHQLNTIGFDNGRYVNFFSERENGIKFQKCFVPTCYDITIYKTLINGGKIILNDTLLHKIHLLVMDEKGNKNEINFSVKVKQAIPHVLKPEAYNFNCSKDFLLYNETTELVIKAGSLTSSYSIKIDKLNNGCVIGNEDMLVVKPIKIKMKVPAIYENKKNKLILMCNGSSLNGQYENGWLKAETKSLGKFNFVYDTIPPAIKRIVSQNKKKSINYSNSVSFKVADNLSGIADYHIYINDVWQIAEYDAKVGTITCYFNAQVPLGRLHVRTEVFDRLGNLGKLEFILDR